MSSCFGGKGWNEDDAFCPPGRGSDAIRARDVPAKIRLLTNALMAGPIMSSCLPHFSAYFES